MAAASVDILIEQNATYQNLITVRDADGDPVDITGETYTAQVRLTATSDESVGSFTFDIDADQVANTGQVLMSMSAAETLAIPVNNQLKSARKLTPYAYDVIRTKLDGTSDRILEGIASVSPSVTR